MRLPLFISVKECSKNPGENVIRIFWVEFIKVYQTLITLMVCTDNTKQTRNISDICEKKLVGICVYKVQKSIKNPGETITRIIIDKRFNLNLPLFIHHFTSFI